MNKGRFYRFVAIFGAWVLFAAVAYAQQTVYKWVDKDGVVHFGESPPAGIDAERITTQAPPSKTPQPRPPEVPPVKSPEQSPSDQVSEVVMPVPAAVPAAEMSLRELDARCEAAREAKIAPLREAEIQRCKAQPRADPEFCERHNADFGEGGRTVTGAIRPRMFDDLPECVTALQESNRRRN